MFSILLSSQLYKYYSLLASLPQIGCLGFLCIKYPILFLKGAKANGSEVREDCFLTNECIVMNLPSVVVSL